MQTSGPASAVAFIGLHHFTLDKAARTAVPAEWRQGLAVTDVDPTLLCITRGRDGGLWVFSQAQWRRFEERICKIGQARRARNLVDFFVSLAMVVQLDQRGRVRVPPSLREWAELEKDVVWVGAPDRMELWAAKRWASRPESFVAVDD